MRPPQMVWPCLILLVWSSSSWSQEESRFPSATTDPVLSDCVIRVADDIDVPANVAGVLVHLGVVRGSRVDAEGEIGLVDDRETHMQKRVASLQYQAAYARYKDEIEVTYAKKAAEVALEDYRQLQETNRISPKSVPQSDIRRAELDAERSNLAIEKAIHDRKLARYDAHVRNAEVQAAELSIKRCMIRAPFAGEVVEVLRHQGEWVNPGDPILRLVRLDTLHVDGKLDIESYDPREIQGCQVTVDVRAGKGQPRQAKGRIIHVSPMIRFEGEYRYGVRAEISNDLEEGHWRILPGVEARMTIHLGTADVNVSQR